MDNGSACRVHDQQRFAVGNRDIQQNSVADRRNGLDPRISGQQQICAQGRALRRGRAVTMASRGKAAYDRHGDGRRTRQQQNAQNDDQGLKCPHESAHFPQQRPG